MDELSLVVVPFHDWKKCEREGFRTRDAHLMLEFSKNSIVNKLLVINRPISFAEIALLRRNWRVKRGKLLNKRKGNYLSQVASNTFTLDIVVLETIRPMIMRRNWIPYIFGKPFISEAVISALRYLDMENNYHMFISEPLYVPLVRSLSPTTLTFDAQDNLLKHPLYRNVSGLAEFYDYCLMNADFIYANSRETTRWLAQKRTDATYIPNGVDTTIFTSSHKYSLPKDIASLPRPIVGYAGKMQELFDVDMLIAAAKEFPEVTFVCIGQQLNPRWVKPLWNYRNIHYLGDKHYTALPYYLNSFDICMIPANPSHQHGGDPIKFYEYLAMGKPVVTTNIGGVSAFAAFPQVKIVSNETEFIAALHFFLDIIGRGEKIAIQELSQDVLWSTKAQYILNTILEKNCNNA